MLKREIKRLVGQQSVNDFKFLRAKAFEKFGMETFSYPAFFGIDRTLMRLFSYKRDGRFIEVGANDGFSQSNTYALERFYDWRGILIEPIPQLFERCKRFRPAALAFNCALGAATNGDYTVTS